MVYRVFGLRVRIILLCDFNARVGNEVIIVVGKFGVLVVNENGGRLIGLCLVRKT